MMTYTPGPWRLGTPGPNKCPTVGTNKGLMVAMVAHGEDHPTYGNAHLIATAPELLEVLEECEEYFDNRADADHDGERYIPNTEMRLLTNIRNVMYKAGGGR